jgi:DNA primase
MRSHDKASDNVFNSAPVMRAFVERHWSSTEVREWPNQQGLWLQVPSPDHANDKRRCLGFNLDTGMVVDFYGFKGDFIQYVVHYLGLRSRSEAERLLTDLVIEVGLSPQQVMEAQRPKEAAPPTPSQTDVLLPEITLPPDTFPINLDEELPYLWQQPMRKAQDYLRRRGLTAEEVCEYELHYCFVGRMADRIIVPVRDEWDRLVWYQGRDITGHESRAKKKYLNPFEVDRSKLVYGLSKIKPGSRVVLCEGFFDAIVCRGVVCFGKYINDYQLQRIAVRQPSEIILGFDADLPGADAIFNLVKHYEGLGFRMIVLPLGIKDLGDLTHDRQLVERVIQQAQPWNAITRFALIARAMRGTS